MDKEKVGNDIFMGMAKIVILDWIAKGQYDGNIDLFDKSGKKVGEIMLQATFQKPEMLSLDNSQINGPSTTSRVSTNEKEGDFTDDEILAAFQAFDLDKNNYIGAAEIKHILVNIGERVTDEEVRRKYSVCVQIRLYMVKLTKIFFSFLF